MQPGVGSLDGMWTPSGLKENLAHQWGALWREAAPPSGPHGIHWHTPRGASNHQAHFEELSIIPFYRQEN